MVIEHVRNRARTWDERMSVSVAVAAGKCFVYRIVALGGGKAEGCL